MQPIIQFIEIVNSLLFTAALVVKQLGDSGVQSVIEIRQQGYPYRLDYADFYRRFLLLSVRKDEESTMSSGGGGGSPSQQRTVLADFLRRIRSDLRDDDDDDGNGKNEDGGDSSGDSGVDRFGEGGGFVVGRTKVFLRTHMHVALEGARRRALHAAVSKLQACQRRKQARVRVANMRDVDAHVCALLKTHSGGGGGGDEAAAFRAVVDACGVATAAGLKNKNANALVVVRATLAKQMGVLGEVVLAAAAADAAVSVAVFDAKAAAALLARVPSEHSMHACVVALKQRIEHVAVAAELQRLLRGVNAADDVAASTLRSLEAL
jgi:hypothetical protein